MKKISTLLMALFSSMTFALAQHHPHTTTTYIPITQTPEVTYRYHDGQLTLTDGTILKGRFQYNGRSCFRYRASSQAPLQKFAFSIVRRLALVGADTLVNPRTDSTVFVRLGHRLYRQLANGTTMVLDRRFTVDEERGKIGRQLFVMDENGDMHKFTSLQKLNKWFYAYQEQAGNKVSDVFLNQNEIVKAVARLNED